MLRDLLELPVRALLDLLPETLAETVLALGLRNQVLLLVAVAIGALLVITLVFATGTLLHRYLVERTEDRRRALADRIRPLILEALAGDLDLDAVHEAVDPAERIPFVDLLMEYTGTVRGEEREKLRRMAKPHLEPVAKRLFTLLPEQRARSVLILGTLGLTEYETEIVRRLEDPVDNVAFVAARVLADEGGARFARAILEHLPRFDDWSSRYLAEMIASMGSDAVPAVRKVYEDPDAPPRVRTIAADALRQMAFPAVADAAYRILERSSEESPLEGADRELVIASLRILVDRGSPKHAPIVRKFSTHPNPVVRAVAVSARGELGSERDVPVLAEALDDPSRWVALHAARALRSLRAEDTLERLADGGGERAVLCREILSG